LTDKKIFIGWAGATAQHLAGSFVKTFGQYPDLDTFISSQIVGGELWFKEIEKVLDTCDSAIGFVSPGTANRGWFNFEAGYLYGKGKTYHLVLLGGKMAEMLPSDSPLSHRQATDGNDKAQMIKLMKEIIGDKARDDYIAFLFDQWIKEFNSLEGQLKWEAKIESRFKPLYRAIPKLKEDQELKDHEALDILITESINEVSDQIQAVQKSRKFSAPATQWSYNLVKLKEALGDKLTLKAVSIVDQQDTFWLQDIGAKIMRNSKKETDERIFVFKNDESFDIYFDKIKEHAEYYNVRLISLQTLTSLFPRYVKDLGILTVDSSSLLALYDRTESQKKILYSMLSDKIKEYEEKFEEIKKHAMKFPEDKDVDEIKAELFEGSGGFERRFVEMSIYTSVWDYHESTKKHPYYEKMCDEMVKACRDHRKTETESCEILEFGAGSGSFTEKLAEIPKANILAFEIDWVYYLLAKHHLAKYENIRIENADARKIDPGGPGVKYDYIFSCFLDHHIRSTDKFKYLRNVKNNLNKNGLFIVGDKFLRDYDEKNEQEHIEALKAFHGHVIQIAEDEGHDEFAQMEEETLNAKTDPENIQVMDYKVSCRMYEDDLRQAGLKVKSALKIGPADREDAGGVYVYVIELAF